jgi:hypothetical protein
MARQAESLVKNECHACSKPFDFYCTCTYNSSTSISGVGHSMYSVATVAARQWSHANGYSPHDFMLLLEQLDRVDFACIMVPVVLASPARSCSV